MKFIEDRGSPFSSSTHKHLQNVASIKDELLQAAQKGQEIYEQHREERYLRKTKQLYDKIPRVDMKRMKSNKERSITTAKRTIK